jgi:hypothetical protein
MCIIGTLADHALNLDAPSPAIYYLPCGGFSKLAAAF